MISTVTVSTISTVSTVIAVGMAATLSLAITVTLISFLTAKELVSVRASGSSQRIGRFLNVGITPLLMVCAVMITMAITEIL